MNPKLHEAVAIFKALGWETVTPENVLHLPLGTAEQKRLALAGLKSGEWGEFAELSENTYGWRSYLDVEPGNLALFAIRIGVDARRAAHILSAKNNGLLVTVVAERGPQYAANFIGHACVSRRRAFEHSSSAFGSVAVLLVDKLTMAIPHNVEYMKDWSVYAAAAMGLQAEIIPDHQTDLPGLAVIKKRFAEHMQTGVAVNTPATGPFGAVLPAGVKRGWLSRAKGLELVFAALDASVRPGDRKVWLGVLDELGVSDEELAARTETLIPLLANGDTAVITRLAPVLISRAEDNLLPEVFLASLAATAKKAKQLVLKSALGRPRPQNAAELASWLSILAGDKDKDITSLATRLMKQWALVVDIPAEEKTELKELWQKTPPLWRVPPFVLGEVAPVALTELAAQLVNRPALVHDVLTERFLAMANAAARKDAAAARLSLGGLRRGEQLFHFMACWAKAEEPRYGFDRTEKKSTYDQNIRDPLTARDYIVSLYLDRLPCLLSTPSSLDLSISVPDLAARLALYQKTAADALEADLFLALTRLDIATKTPAAVKALLQLKVAVLRQSGAQMSVAAGQAALAYLEDPVQEPPLDVQKDGFWQTALTQPHSLGDFPHRFKNYMTELFSVFPSWGDVALRDARWDSEVHHEMGLILRQIARRAAPLPPGASINLLAAQRSHTPDAAADAMLAVTEAWERGLLRPGVADIALLDWSASAPANLAPLAAALENIAREGLLSVIWPLLDALLEASLQAPRLLAGTAELAELVAAFLPEVQAAVAKGAAEQRALDLPGIRTLAQRSGASRAVSAARKVAALLPPVQAVASNAISVAPEPPFEAVWPVGAIEAPFLDDGVTLKVDWSEPALGATRPFLFTLTLPGVFDRVFQVVNGGWCYDLESEGQCQAYAVAPGTTTFRRDKDNQVWLFWDQELQAIAVSDKRNRTGGNDGPLDLAGLAPPPLPVSLLTVLIGLLAQDGDAVYYAPRLLREFIKRGQIDARLIRRATRLLLQNPVVSPAKLVRTLEKDIKLLPVLWPMLTECIKAAGVLVGAGAKPPVWVNRALDIALRYAPYLAEAAQRGYIGAKDRQWTGLSAIAAAKAKSAAGEKAQKLLALLEQ